MVYGMKWWRLHTVDLKNSGLGTWQPGQGVCLLGSMFSQRNSAISLWNFSEKLAILRYGYFLFHGKTALSKIWKFQGETANFSEKFQREIAEFLRENMEPYRQNLKILGRNTGTCISWRKWRISWRNFPLSVFSFFTCTVCDHNITGGWIHMDFPQATGPYSFPSLTNNRSFEAYSSICRRPLHVNYTTHIYIEKSTSPISPNNTLSLMNFYCCFTVFTNRFSRRHIENT